MSILTSLFSRAVRLLGGYRDRSRSYFVSCASMVLGFVGGLRKMGDLGGGSVAVLEKLWDLGFTYRLLLVIIVTLYV